MSIYGNGYINESKKENDVIELVIETGVNLLNEGVLLEDGTGSDSLRFNLKNDRSICLYVRTKDTNHDGATSKHGPSVKIRNPIINGERNITIELPPSDDGDFIIDCNNDKTRKEIKRQYPDLMDIVKHNRSVLYDIYKCTDTKEYKKLIEGILNDEYNKKFKVERKNKS